jgi:hypothetical protein
VTAIVITPNTTSLRGTETQQFTAMGTFSDGTTKDITATAKWATSNNRIAKIAVTGLATAIAVGTVDISAAQDGVSAKVSLTVQAPSVLSTTPNDGDTGVNTARISITFDQAVLSSSLKTQTADGPCTGSLQLSKDDFATCVAFASQPSLVGNVASVGVRNALDAGTTYKIQVTTDILSGFNPAIAGQAFTQATGFTTAN